MNNFTSRREESGADILYTVIQLLSVWGCPCHAMRTHEKYLLILCNNANIKHVKLSFGNVFVIVMVSAKPQLYRLLYLMFKSCFKMNVII